MALRNYPGDVSHCRHTAWRFPASCTKWQHVLVVWFLLDGLLGSSEAASEGAVSPSAVATCLSQWIQAKHPHVLLPGQLCQGGGGILWLWSILWHAKKHACCRRVCEVLGDCRASRLVSYLPRCSPQHAGSCAANAWVYSSIRCAPALCRHISRVALRW